MKKFFKKSICVILCLLLSIASLSSVAVAAYPAGVSQKEALNAVEGTDKLVDFIVPMLMGQDLNGAINTMLYSDEALSDLLVNTYSSFEEMSAEMSMLGIDCSTKKLSAALGKYPQVCVALFNSPTWAEVDLTGVKWGVTEKEGFAEALGAIFSPFNDILYTLLCGGTYKMNNLITINGDSGYENAIVPLLKALKCTDIKSQTFFNIDAMEDKNTMIKNIVLPVLTMLEWAVEAPANNLTEVLPGFAYFVDSGEFNSCFQALLKPITSNPLVEIAVFLKILDLDSLTNIDVNQLIASLTAGEQGGIKLAPIDFAALAACGNMTDSGFVADKGSAYVEIVRWGVETLKLNKDSIGALLGGEGAQGDTAFLTSILDKDTDLITAMFVLLFTPAEIGKAEAMVYPEFKAGTVQNTTKLTDKNLEKVYNEIDDLLSQFIKEGGSYSSVGTMISSSIYTNANINAAVFGIYKAMEDEGLLSVLGLLGINATPKGVAALLGDGYSKAYKVLSNADAWSEVSLKGVTWGFSDGSRRGFQNALTAVLRPLFPLLRTVLAGEDMVIMNSITVRGADGYNTAVIPILEALGCSAMSIKSYTSYKNSSAGDGVLKNVLEPVFDLLDELCEAPVKTIVDVLPNIVYFMESGSLEKCISNLLLPITSILNRTPGVIEIPLDATELTKQLDINTLMNGMLQGMGISGFELDLKQLASLGKASEKTSKAVINGEKVKYTYVESDKNAIILSLLKVIAKVLKTPGNENLLMGSMGSSNPNFDSSTMTNQFKSMSEDELIEWLYNLFFKERVQFEIVTNEEGYMPTIIYKPEPKNNTGLYIFLGYLGLCAVVGVILFVNRKRLYGESEG